MHFVTLRQTKYIVANIIFTIVLKKVTRRLLCLPVQFLWETDESKQVALRIIRDHVSIFCYIHVYRYFIDTDDYRSNTSIHIELQYFFTILRLRWCWWLLLHHVRERLYTKKEIGRFICLVAVSRITCLLYYITGIIVYNFVQRTVIFVFVSYRDVYWNMLGY